MQTRYGTKNSKAAITSLAIICVIGLNPLSRAQSHPSGYTKRVLVLVQNPTGYNSSGNNSIEPTYSLQIENVALEIGSQPSSAGLQYWPYIHGWNGDTPASIENLPSQGEGAVTNEDGSLSIINYANETVTTANAGITSPSAGTIVSQSLSYVMAANKQAGALTIIDQSTTDTPVQLKLAGVSGISVNPGSSVALAFADDSNTVYMIRHLSSADSQAYANGSWPANAIDCEPYGLPTFCAIAVVPPGGNVSTFSAQYFDHPFKAITDATGDVMYVLNAGPEADGTTASVTVLPVGPLALEDGSQTGTIPSTLVNYPVPGGVDDGIVVGSLLYVAGQTQVHPGLWAGELTVINPANTAQPVGTMQPMADGTPVRMAIGDDNTLWIGSIKCNTGANEYEQQLGGGATSGCLTVVNTTNTGSVAYVEPYLCDLDTATPCSSTYTPMINFQTGGSGDVTGIAPIIGSHIVYYVELGQVHVRSTAFTTGIYPMQSSYSDSEFDNYNNVTVAGTAVDVVYMDATSDSDGTATSTIH